MPRGPGCAAHTQSTSSTTPIAATREVVFIGLDIIGIERIIHKLATNDLRFESGTSKPLASVGRLNAAGLK